jgi:hypothetical protein
LGAQDVKFDNATDLFFIVAVSVPGFVFNAVFTTFVPRHESRFREVMLLMLLTGSALNYAVCSPLIYLLVTRSLFTSSQLAAGVTWLLIIFVAPIALGLICASISQRRWLRVVYHRLRLRSIDPIPTGWDWKFSRTGPCYVLVTLRDQIELAGYFGDDSMASSDPAFRDLYLEKVYTIRDDGQWVPREESKGVYIEGSQIIFVEFFNER